MGSTPTARHGDQPIAIIGLSCRLPGAPDADRFWDLLVGGEDHLGAPGATRTHTRNSPGGYLDDVSGFDAAFFDISPREADRMDPQHRMLTEATWTALEDAGLSAPALAASNTGVYAACLGSTYWDLLRSHGANDMHGLMGAGLHGTAAGRISRLLDLRGPSMALDATCSTSLLAVHLACQGLRSGETDLAIVTGSNTLLDGGYWDSLTRGRVLAPDGRSKFGSPDANGYGRGEGAAAVVLKPLDAALADGDRVRAVVLGSAAGNNGRTSVALTTPSEQGQEDTVRRAYRNAGVRPADVDYVEAHGTGTVAGDRVELAVLNRVLGEGRPEGRRCLVGSVKTNIGHHEAAAGLVGLVKTVLAVEHRTVPPTLHGPAGGGDRASVELPPRATPWPERHGPALAGVSSFGLSGTNVHVVVGEAPAVREPDAARRPSAYLLPLSARCPAALRQLAGAYADRLAEDDLLDVCFSAGARRTHHEHRIAVAGPDRRSIVRRLRAYADGSVRARSKTGPQTAPKVVFVFPGQGSQWVGMGRELLVESEVFAARLRECDAAVRAETGWSVVDRLHDDAPLTAVGEVQPVLWAVQVALAAVWRGWGVEPDLVLGHSMGEVAAATVSGALSVADGAAVICRRSALIAEHCRPGAMVAVQVGEREASRALAPFEDRLCVGVVNSEDATVLSGDHDAVVEVTESLRALGVPCRRVDVEFASHAPQVEPVRPWLLESLSGLRPAAGSVPLHSTVLDRVVDGSRLRADYWMDNLRLPVRFASAVSSIAAAGPVVFVEISPHPVLVPAVEDCVERSGGWGAAVASTHRGRPQLESMLAGLGVVHVEGGPVDWDRVHPGGRYVPVPAYPFQHRSFWFARPRRTAPEDRCAGAPVPELRTVADFECYVRDQVAGLLHTDDVDLDRTATALGVDSLLAMQLRSIVEDHLSIAVPPRLLLGAGSLRTLAGELHARAALATVG